MRAVEQPCLVTRSALRRWILTLVAAAAWTIVSSGTAFAQHWTFGAAAPGRPAALASGSSQRTPAVRTPAASSRAAVASPSAPSARSTASSTDLRRPGLINLSLAPILTSEREDSVSGVEGLGHPQPLPALGNSMVVTLDCRLGSSGVGVSWDWGLAINRAP